MGNLYVGKYFSVPVYLNFTFFIYLIFMYGLYDLNGLIFGLLTSSFCLLHEFGHTLMAQYYGLRVNNIIVHIFGCIVSIDDLDDNLYEELMVTICGPLVNICLSLFFGVLYFFCYGQINTIIDSLLEDCLLINIFLGLFNLLPFFPLDGGWILRDLLFLWTHQTFSFVTSIVAHMGIVVGIISMICGLICLQPLFSIGGMIVFISSNQIYMRNC